MVIAHQPPQHPREGFQQRIPFDEFAVERVKRENCRPRRSRLRQDVAAAKSERERVDIVHHVGRKVLDRLDEPAIRQSNSIFGIGRKRETPELDDRDRRILSPVGLRGNDQNLVPLIEQVVNQVHRPDDDAVHLGKKDFGDDCDSHIVCLSLAGGVAAAEFPRPWTRPYYARECCRECQH